MVYLITGYFGGVVVGRLVFLDVMRMHFDAYAAAALLATVAGVAVGHYLKSARAPLLRMIFLVCAGILWGLLNSAPIPDKKILATVLRTNVRQGATPALVASRDGAVYEVSKTEHPEGEGLVTVWKRAGVFSSQRATMASTFVMEAEPPSRWNEWTQKVREDFATAIEGYGPAMAAWLRSAVLGLPDELNASVARAFRRTGLMHIVVVSGSHVTMVAVGAMALFATPFRVAYSLRLFSPGRWIGTSILIKIVVVACVLFFCSLVGASHASQRAVLGFAVLTGSRIFMGDLNVMVRLKFTALTQIIFFPIGLLCESTAMSWLAYLMVVEHVGLPASGNRFLRSLKLQAALSILMGAMCGQWSILGILVNMLIIPIVPVVFGFGILLVFPRLLPVFLRDLALGIQEGFLKFVCWISELTDGLPLMVVNFSGDDLWFRFLLLVLGVIIFLNSWAGMSIRQREH